MIWSYNEWEGVSCIGGGEMEGEDSLSDGERGTKERLEEKMDLQLTKPGRCRKYCKSTLVYGEFIREGRMKKSRSENVKIIGENGKADVTFTWEKHRDGSANLVGQIMVGLFSKLSSHQIKMSL